MKIICASILLFALVCSSCLPKCGNDTINQFESPDKKLKIVLFSRNCGATTGFNLQAYLLNSGEKLPNKGGNIFITDSGLVNVAWVSNNEVLVHFDKDVRIYKQEPERSNVNFKYIQDK
jgi:hypothetical protein